MSTEYVLPFRPSIGNYRFGTTIGGTPYIFDVRWNSRDNVDRTTGIAKGAFYFDVREENLQPIARGIKIVLGAYLGRRVNHRLFKSGVFAAQDSTNKGREATYDDLGVRVLIKYIPVPELVRRLSIAR